MPKTVGWRIRFNKSILLGMSQTDKALGKVSQLRLTRFGWFVVGQLAVCSLLWHVYTPSQVRPIQSQPSHLLSQQSPLHSLVVLWLPNILTMSFSQSNIFTCRREVHSGPDRGWGLQRLRGGQKIRNLQRLVRARGRSFSRFSLAFEAAG